MKSSAALLVMLALLAAGGALVPIPQEGFSRPPSTEGDKTELKRRGTFTIGEETTYVTGPLDKDGYIDYVTALNQRLSKGVTPANNANVLLWKVLGPPRLRVRPMPPEFFKWLDMPQPPEQGQYFLPLDRFIRERLRLDPGTAADKITAQHERVGRWPWTPADYPAIASWLRVNEKPLAVAIQASKRSHYYLPLTPHRTNKGPKGLVTALLPSVQGCREIVNALVGRAMLRLGQGDTEGAWQDLLACHRLGRLVSQGGTIIEGLVGIAIDAIASHADLVWLDRARPDAKRIERCLNDLRQLPPLAASISKVDIGERFWNLETVMLLDRYGARYFVDLAEHPEQPVNPFRDQILRDIEWDPALRTINRWFDRLVAGLRGKDRVEREKKWQQFEKELKELKDKISAPAYVHNLLPGGKATAAARGQFIGDLLVCLMMPAMGKVQQAEDRSHQTQDNLAVAFALAWYQRDHGRYPKTLDALAPKYLAKVPQDRFSGKPLIYRPAANGYLLYSVGPNGKDEGGRSYSDTPAGDDLPVRMPLPEPRK
jgi:hypothetical protein